MIEQRIVAALANENAGSDALTELIRETEQAAQTFEQTANQERAKALDLSSDPKAAHERVVDAEISRDRLNTALPKLRDKLTEALAKEANDRWWSNHKRVKEKLDEAVTLFKTYGEHAEAISNLFALAANVDKEISDLNGSAPDGVNHRLRPVELEARNLDRFDRDNPSLSSTVELRSWANSGRKLWPRTSSGSFAAMAVAGMTVPHPGSHWADPATQRQRREQIEKENAHSAAFHEQAAKDEEARLNREERERFA